MKFKFNRAVFSAVLICYLVMLAITVPCLHATDVPEKPSNYVVDLAGVLDSATKSKLNGYLKELEQKTTAQFIILTVKSPVREPCVTVSRMDTGSLIMIRGL